MKKLLLFLILCTIVFSFKSGRKSLLTFPSKWPALQYNLQENPLSKEKVELGRALFYDPILSADNKISCASCHSPYNAFAHTDHALSHGINDRIGSRNAPALMNLAWQKTFMWDGAITHLDMQALAPISHPDEMNESIKHVVEKLNQSEFYRKRFGVAFPTSSITGEQTLKAISQFMVTLVSCNSKYDSVILKQAVFTSQEENGYHLFKKNCSGCHTEPLFTNGNFENNGLSVDLTLNDTGRMKITNDSADIYKFKVPTLRNIEFTYPYMHDGRFKKLGEVLNHYTNGIQHFSNLSEKLKSPVVLSSNEKVDIISFLLTLSDKKFLFNPDYSFPNSLLTANKQ